MGTFYDTQIIHGETVACLTYEPRSPYGTRKRYLSLPKALVRLLTNIHYFDRFGTFIWVSDVKHIFSAFYYLHNVTPPIVIPEKG